MGLVQAPAYFHWLIIEVISGLDFAFSYLDDILIYGPNPETHLRHFQVVFQCLLKTRLKLKEIKCNILKIHIQYLGHLISETGIEPLPEMLDSLQDMPPPRNLKEVKQFLGLAGYNGKFIQRFADNLWPLTALTKEDIPYDWMSKCQDSFDILKK